MADMKGKEKITLPSNSSKLTGNHFTSSEIVKFTDDPIEQKMIDRFGLVCPSCAKVLLKKFCPDCGTKTIAPNFCKPCNLESSSQFCENCGTAIYTQGMDPKKFLYLSGNNLERQMNKLVALLSSPSDYQFQIFSLIEIVIQVLSETKKEISLLSEKFKKLDEKLDGIDHSIIDVENEIERSLKRPLEENSDNIKTIESCLKNITNCVTEAGFNDCNIVLVLNDIANKINKIEEKGVYIKGYL